VSQPRNVTPGHESDPASAAGGFLDDDTNAQVAPEWKVWSWAADRDRSFPWLGLLLVLVGAGLLVQYFVPSISAGTLILGAIAIAFLAGWIFGGSYFAMVPGLLIGALVVGAVIGETGLYTGPGTTSVCVALAFGLIWLIGYLNGRRAVWPLWGLAIFGLIGIAQIIGQISIAPNLGALWPLLIIGVGGLLILNARRPSSRAVRRRRR
jgi:hypothetical protein